jgi:hypothetical protein
MHSVEGCCETGFDFLSRNFPVERIRIQHIFVFI